MRSKWPHLTATRCNQNIPTRFNWWQTALLSLDFVELFKFGHNDLPLWHEGPEGARACMDLCLWQQPSKPELVYLCYGWKFQIWPIFETEQAVLEPTRLISILMVIGATTSKLHNYLVSVEYDQRCCKPWLRSEWSLTSVNDFGWIVFSWMDQQL